MELKNRLERSLEFAIAPTLMFDYPTVEALAAHLAQQVSLKLTKLADAPTQDVANSAAPADAEMAGLLAELEGLSDDELAALLAEELA
jgi:polyketide synthase 12